MSLSCLFVSSGRKGASLNYSTVSPVDVYTYGSMPNYSGEAIQYANNQNQLMDACWRSVLD